MLSVKPINTGSPSSNVICEFKSSIIIDIHQSLDTALLNGFTFFSNSTFVLDSPYMRNLQHTTRTILWSTGSTPEFELINYILDCPCFTESLGAKVKL